MRSRCPSCGAQWGRAPRWFHHLLLSVWCRWCQDATPQMQHYNPDEHPGADPTRWRARRLADINYHGSYEW